MLRQILLDILANRSDRYYWRQENKKINISKNSTLLVWQPDGKFGDAIIASSFLISIKHQRPDIKISICCGKNLVDFWQNIPEVDLAFCDNILKNFRKIESLNRQNPRIFISLETFLSFKVCLILKKIQPDYCIGFSVANYKIFTHSITDHTLNFPRKHISERYRNLCDLLNINFSQNIDLRTRSMNFETNSSRYLQNIKNVIFLNPFGATDNRSFNRETIFWLLKTILTLRPNYRVFINCPFDKRNNLANLLSNIPLTQNIDFIACEEKLSSWELINLISNCAVAITPDTSITHIASALNIITLVFYSENNYNPSVWHPTSTVHEIVLPLQNGNINSFDKYHTAELFSNIIPISEKIQ